MQGTDIKNLDIITTSHKTKMLAGPNATTSCCLPLLSKNNHGHPLGKQQIGQFPPIYTCMQSSESQHSQNSMKHDFMEFQNLPSICTCGWLQVFLAQCQSNTFCTMVFDKKSPHTHGHIHVNSFHLWK